ncbi:VOC family protein [Kaarinaea lacus]
MVIKSCINKYFSIALLLFFASSPFQFAVSAPTLPPLSSPPSGKQLTGKFVWFELATLNLEKQQAFYSDVFGWTFQTISNTDDQYTLVKNGDRSVAGMFSIKPREGVTTAAAWIGLMSIDDPVKTANFVKANGGVVQSEPKSIANRGTYALLVDPEGALFGVLKSETGDPPDREVGIGDFFWMDLFAREPTKAGEFYQQVAGYELSKGEVKEDVDRVILTSHGKSRAGVVPLPDEANRAGWLPYIRVADVKATLKKVTAAGGFIMVEPTPELLDGNLAIFSDPQGGVMGVVKWTEPATDKE